MLVLSNRDVFLLGEVTNDGIQAVAIWLKDKAIAGTNQELWNRLESTVHSSVHIPKQTAQVHTDILLPYVETTSLAA